MRLTVTLNSYALCGSGEGAGLIDSDTVHDSHGIPYLPGKRLKGLLRESALEVTEMLGMASPALVAYVFGRDGFQPGIVQTPNLYPQGYATWADVLPKLLEAKHNTLVTPAAILTEFSAIRQQTAIDCEGIAKDASLRIARMLKPGLVFEGDLTVADQGAPVSALLWLAARNLRRFGTRRNRGQGTISCILSATTAWNVRDAIGEVTKWTTPAIRGPASVSDQIAAEDNAPATLMMTVRTLSPAVLAIHSGDQNTVNTAPFIPGSTLKGMLVDRVRQSLGLQTGKEHESSLFRALFLEHGEKSLFASPAFPVINEAVYTPAPLYLHQDKTEPRRLHNLLASRPTDTEPVHGLISLTTAGFLNKEPDTTLFFHTQRAQDRKQGKSSDDDGAIFYYEAMERGQEFSATLQGPKCLLDLIFSLGASFSASIGRSRSAQYGQVQVTLDKPSVHHEYDEDEDLIDGDQTLLTCLTPLIVRNPSGFPEASAANLGVCLARALAETGITVSVISSYARPTTVEPFVGVMGCSLPACEAFREGSSFLLGIPGMSSTDLSQRLKKVERTGLGEWCAMGFGSVTFSTPPTNQSYSVRFDDRISPSLASSIPTGLKAVIIGIIHREEEAYLAEQGMKDAKAFTENSKKHLHNHQIGRLEGFVVKATTVNELQAVLGALRDNAKKKLEACQTGARVSILEKITSFTGPIQNHLAQFRGDHKKLLEATGITSLSDDDRFRLAKCYWLALLRRLRKLNKEKN